MVKVVMDVRPAERAMMFLYYGIEAVCMPADVINDHEGCRTVS